MKLIYKILPYAILLVAAGFMMGMAGGESIWGYIGLGMIVAPVVAVLGVVIVLSIVYWRRDKSPNHSKLSQVSGVLILNALMALLLFGFVTWKDINILNDDNLFLIVWMGINIGGLRQIWVPKEEETPPNGESVGGASDNKKEEA